MLYDSYHKKITKLVKSLKILLRCIVVLCIVNVVIFLGIVTFMATKGIVFDSWFVDESFEITYGEKLPLKSHALFARVFYEYSEDGEEWTREEPDRDGEYMVRASAKGIFGKTRSGKTYSYELNPKKTNVKITDTEIVYGDFPDISADLVSGDKIVCDKVIYTDRLAAKTDVVPSKDDFKILNSDGKNVTKLYDIKFVTTQIEILPRDITITVPDKEMVYNGSPLSYNQYEMTKGSLAKGDVIQATFDKVLVDVTGDEGIKNTPNIAIFASDGLNIGVHYNITMDIGTLKVIPRPIIIKTADEEKVYDDKVLVNNSYQILECPPEIDPADYGLIASHKIVYGEKVVSITNVGKIDNWLELHIVDASGADKTANYALEYELGQLIVTPRPINISTKSGTWTYDGAEHHIPPETIEGFCPGHVAKYSWPEIIDAGTVENTVTISSILSEDGRNVLSNYEIIVGETGTLTINKRPITIKHQSVATGSVTYDGVERTFPAYEITSELGLAENDTLNIIYPKFSQAGTYENENKIVSAEVLSRRENGVKRFNISDNYEVTEVFGTIVIDKCKITVEPIERSKVYDGLSLSTVGNKADNLPYRHEINVVYKETSVDVGEYLAEIDLEKTTITYNGADVTHNFDITVKPTNLTITPRKITIKAGSASKPYDGTPIIASGFSFAYGSLAQGQKITLVCIGSQTEIGQSANVIDKESIVITDANGDPISKNNYDITCEDGILEILLRKLAITTNSETKTYDAIELRGKEATVDEISDNNDGLLEGHKLVYTLSGSIINVGKVDNEISDLDIVDQNGQSVKQYYDIDNISITEGVLEITPVKLTINTGSKDSVYNKEPLTYDYYEIDSLDKLCGGDTITVIVDGTITDVGKTRNTAYHVIYNKDGEDVTSLGNYEVTYNFGTLEITPRIIRVKPLPTETSKVYDGTPLECIDYEDVSNTEQSEGLLEGDVLSSLIFTSITDVGNINIDVNKYVVLDASNEDLSANYKIIVDGDHTLEITKRPIDVESESDEKEYDGRPLTNSNYDFGELLPGHTIEVTITGKQTEVGESDNTVSEVLIYDENHKDVTKNYDIKIHEGTLRVYQIVVAKVKSDKGGYIYLKTKSYGDYIPDNNQFGPAPTMNYSFTYNGVKSSYMLWSSLTLMRNAYYQNTLEVTEAKKYMLPYYMAYGGNYTMPNYSSEDYTLLSTSSSYTVPYYDYSYEKEGTALFRQYYNPSGYYNYTNDVNSYYMVVPQSTREVLDAIIAVNEFNSSYMTTEERVRAVATYIRSIGTYNLNYDIKLDSETDVPAAFLTKYHEGSSKHFAMAAMLMYRTLGIPARYVEGYYVEAEPNVTTDVTIKHSWVEVFIPRCGWMQVEVTSGFGDYDSDKEQLTVKPVDLSKPYDGDPLEAKNEVEKTDAVQALLDKGYSIEVICEGSQTDIGISESQITSIKILDELGRNVTYKFDITKEKGTLEVTKIPIKVCFYTAAKTYDGEKLEHTLYTLEDSDFDATGYMLEIAYIYDQTDVYTLTIADIMNGELDFSNYFSFKVMNGDEDITHLYYIELIPDEAVNLEVPTDYVVARINPRVIKVSTGSSEAHYLEGAELSNNIITVIEGPLVEGHRLNAETDAKLTEVGSIQNTIKEGMNICDTLNGERDVTHNYVIELYLGTLTFLDQEIKK